ncbi:hypothetical protein ROZALSC1DRAFT_30014 [Rozella allomycis CSF55]|uniref:Uncharacterized protein n=1 Tax=Rozella allomycis (strain CSF55) TaxID=988480 RepID=A0A4P9YFL4_ROZAC|nr:hypothetical protein ROZALSC1DRAFT_30014 [Rozella allomycis CSF55]
MSNSKRTLCLTSSNEQTVENEIFVSREVNSSGARHYAYTDIKTFFDYYSVLGSCNKTCYEIIRKDVLVKFFMDIDCQYQAVINEFPSLGLKWYLAKALRGMGINDAEEIVNNVIVLDASKGTKISLHLVFQKFVFPSIERCCAVLRWVVNNLYELAYPMYDEHGVTADGF